MAGENEKEEKGQGKDTDSSMPYCTSAPDPEHHRGHHEEEPCYDAREGDLGHVSREGINPEYERDEQEPD